CQQHNTYPPTF
nr:immunoglobulin light chain junction region [Macaca mulatta]MOV37387.1 immunoglobulin light chain junction region [Macaca mulatta]MOV37512.1 immunoglobulin light chain junction region [Macaca mulatta]MOV61054.1 immunoglobulin light chain junction region [Macaca mulatta]MOV62262.1 immunoglobulin light chain junction region [Macaca mulatta]